MAVAKLINSSSPSLSGYQLGSFDEPSPAPKLNVNVTFRDTVIEPEQASDQIAGIDSPLIYMWYIGSYGFKKGGAKFYRDALISPIYNKNNKATFCLVDLTAWAAFKNLNVPITKESGFTSQISNIHSNIHCISSASILKKIESVADSALIDHFDKTLQQEFINKKSNNFPDNGITIEQIFPSHPPIISRFHKVDTSKAYSALQYLEACFLVEEAIGLQPNKEEVDIVFALPNDENEYYRDDLNTFGCDLEFFLNQRLQDISSDKTVNVQFISFKYGDSLEQRPYNSPGQVFKKGKISLTEIITEENSCQV